MNFISVRILPSLRLFLYFWIPITLLFGGIIYFSTDSKPYDDKHLEIKIKKVPDKQNGYLKIMEAAKSMVWIDDLTSKQSVYIGGLSVEERHNKFFIVDKKDKDRQSIFIYSIF